MTVGPVTRDAATAEFFDGTAAGQFLLRHCTACGTLSAPQAAQCERCSSTALDWRPASGGATLVSWTVAHGKPDASGKTHRTILGIAELWSEERGRGPLLPKWLRVVTVVLLVYGFALLITQSHGGGGGGGGG